MAELSKKKSKDHGKGAPRKDRAPREGPTADVSEVASQITDLVETAKEAEALADDNTVLQSIVLDQKKALAESEKRALDLATAADYISEQDVQNLQTVRAQIEFRMRVTASKPGPLVTLRGTGRYRMALSGPSLKAVLMSLRAALGQVS